MANICRSWDFLFSLKSSACKGRSKDGLMTNKAFWTICRGKTNFFEKRVGDYQKAGVMAGLAADGHAHAISFDEDF
jgi:hypothetical protein